MPQHGDSLTARDLLPDARKLTARDQSTNGRRDYRLILRCRNHAPGCSNLPRDRLRFSLRQFHFDEPLLFHQKGHCAGGLFGGRRGSVFFFHGAARDDKVAHGGNDRDERNGEQQPAWSLMAARQFFRV